MTTITTKRIRNWVTLAMSLVLVTSLGIWIFGQQKLPTIRIATGDEEGLYYKVGTTIEGSLEKRTGRKVNFFETKGSAENYGYLVDDASEKADLAILQGGAVKIQNVSVVTPLFREYVFVIARKGLEITSVWDLHGHTVCLGDEKSGSRTAAIKVIEHFGLVLDDLTVRNDMPLETMEDDESIDAAIITAGIGHPGLGRLLASNKFELVPIRSAIALELVHPFFRNDVIPRGLFAEHPAVPPDSTPTIATTAFLVSRNDTADDIVQAALASIHEESLRLEVPTLIPRQEVPAWTTTKMHPVAQRYFHPADDIGRLTTVMESIVAMKELCLALGAGVYLLWVRWRRLKEQEDQVVVDRQKEHLDGFLMKTLDIERAQMRSDDVDQLQGYLDSVTQIKLQALQELTEEELRGNQSFSIFLDQCSNLIGKIQLKILSLQAIRD